MKNISYLLLTLFFFSSCKKQLEESPKFIAAEVFYNTAPEVAAAINAIYGPLREANCMGGLYPAQLEAYGDYIYGRGSYAPLNDYAGLDNTNIIRTGFMWDFFYRSIRNANLVIANAPKGSAINAADVSRYVAEARFMRAFVYFQLVRNWGGLPIRTEANMTEQNTKRSTAADVYQLITDDLAKAETDLPDAPAQPGRPSKWAAKSLLADVYLTTQRYPEATAKANEVITSNKYSLLSVTTAADYDKIYGADVATSSEEIFFLKFSRSGNNQGWQFVTFAHHPASPFLKGIGFFALYTDTVLNSAIKTWDVADLRKSFNLYSFNIGLGANTFLFRKFKDPAAANQFNPGNDYPLYKYSDVLLIYAEAASRVNNGPTALAIERLNMVHRRAYGYGATVVSPVDFVLANYTAQTFLDLVVKERGYETVFEAKRWLDLKRLGTVKQVIQQVKGKVVADKHLLWPIPDSELNHNKGMDRTKDQNPGY